MALTRQAGVGRAAEAALLLSNGNCVSISAPIEAAVIWRQAAGRATHDDARERSEGPPAESARILGTGRYGVCLAYGLTTPASSGARPRAFFE